MSKELKSNKIQFEDGFRLRDFMDVMDEVDSFLLKKGHRNPRPLGANSPNRSQTRTIGR